MEKRDKHIESVKAFVSPEPYPPIVVAGKNRLYAGLMHMNMCAAHSELTALMQYLYQSWVMNANHAEAAQDLQRIAMVEMHHLNILRSSSSSWAGIRFMPFRSGGAGGSGME